jgi:hypothetical protein
MLLFPKVRQSGIRQGTSGSKSMQRIMASTVSEYIRNLEKDLCFQDRFNSKVMDEEAPQVKRLQERPFMEACAKNCCSWGRDMIISWIHTLRSSKNLHTSIALTNTSWIGFRRGWLVCSAYCTAIDNRIRIDVTNIG